MKPKVRAVVVALFLAMLQWTSSSCIPSRGTVRAGTSDPLVMIEAGLARFPGGGFFVRYLIDRSTRTCWLVMGGSVAPLDCCKLWRVETARQHMGWDACRADSGSQAPPAPPPPRSNP